MITIRKFSREARRYRAAMRHYGTHPLSCLGLFLSLYGRERFSPDEIFGLGLLDPALPEGERRQLVSNEKMLHVQLLINGRDASRRVDDKLEFQRVAESAGLPVPAYHATFAANGEQVGAAPTLRDRSDWERFWRNLPDGPLILKPVAGTHGSGVTLIEPDDGHLLVNREQAMTPGELLTMVQGSGYDRWLIQQAISGHADITRLTGSPALQTLRLVTVIRGGDVKVVAARFRINGGSQIFDNFDGGRTGNLIATVDRVSGRIRHVKAGDPSGFGLLTVNHHPRTGAVLSGWKLPLWDEAVAVAKAAALAFVPAVTVGWDIGITDRGVFLIEGNPSWDPLPGEPVLHIYEDLERAARTLSPS